MITRAGVLRFQARNFTADEHTLIRFFERGGGKLSAALIDANREVCRGRLYRLPEGKDVLVRGGAGAFVGQVEDDGFDGLGRVHARTWLAPGNA